MTEDKTTPKTGSTLFAPNGERISGEAVMKTPAQRLEFLNGQLQGHILKLEKAAKFLALKLDQIAKARQAYENAHSEAGTVEETDKAVETFMAAIDVALEKDFIPE